MKRDKLKIVIVEDDAFYGEILRKYVYQVVDRKIPEKDVSIMHFISAEECMECLDPETNIFLLDYNLVGDDNEASQNGLDLLKTIKKMCPQAYFIIVTSYGDFSTIKKFAMEGADKYVLKNEDTPIRINAILKHLIQQSLVRK